MTARNIKMEILLWCEPCDAFLLEKLHLEGGHLKIKHQALWAGVLFLNVHPQGLEPWTVSLKGSCSTI
jgi:hypothetical protein